MKVYPLAQFFLVITAVTILSLLYFFYPATSFDFYPNCIFNSLTGLYCPGCGSQRAVSALLHARLDKAIDYNLLMVLSTPLILYSAVAFTWNIFSKKKLTQKLFYSPVFIRVFLSAVILFAVLRNIPVYPFSWLAP